MKNKLVSLGHSLSAVVLTICMLFGMFATTILATTEALDNELENGSNNSNPINNATEEETLVYASIGDSMTNGYGLEGYDGISGLVNYGIYTYGNQFAAWLAGADPAKTEDGQVIFEGENGVVDHRQLAMSGLRAEDLHWLLDLDPADEDTLANAIEGYMAHGWNMQGHDYWFKELGFRAGDRRTWNELTDPDYRLANGVANLLVTYDKPENKQYFYPDSVSDDVLQRMTQMAKNGFAEDRADAAEWPYNHSSFETRGQIKANGYHHYLQIAAEFYQESIADADVISLALGNTNFGTWMFDYMQDVFANENETNFLDRYFTQDIYDYYMEGFDDSVKIKIAELMDLVDPIIEANFDVETFGQKRADKVKYIIKHCVLSFLVNYVACVGHIVELNPDVQLIQVSLMNAYASKSESGDDGESFSDIIDILYGPLNAFIAAVPSFLRAANSEKYKDVKFYFADMSSVETVSDVYGDDFYLDGEGNPMKYPGLNTENVEGHMVNTVVRDRFHHWIASADIKTEYVRDADPSYGEVWKHLLKHINNGTIFGYGIRMVSLQNIRDYELMSDEEIAAVMNGSDQKQKDLLFSCAIYRAFENAIIEAGRSEFTIEGLGNFSGINVSAFSNAMSAFYVAMGAQDATQTLNLTSAADLRAVSEKLNDALMADEGVVTILCLANRMEIGSGIGGHPSNGGHNDMFNITSDSYNNYTSEEELDRILGETELEDLYFCLLSKGYLTLDQTLEIVSEIANYLDLGNLDEIVITTEDMVEIVDYVYSYIVDHNVNADARIDIVSSVYGAIKGDLPQEYSSALDTIGAIYVRLYDAELITNAEAFAIIDFIYDRVVDCEIDSTDVYNIITYIYKTLFFVDDFTALAASDAGVVDEIAVVDKVEILNIIFDELAGGGLAESIPALDVVVGLYDELGADENVSDEAIVILIDIMLGAIAEKSESGEDIDVQELVFDVADGFITNEELDVVTKAAVADKLVNIAEDNGIEADVPDLTKIAAVFDALKAAGYIDESDINAILGRVMSAVASGELDFSEGVKLFLYAYGLVLADLSLAEKGEFLVELYNAIREAYDMSHAGAIIVGIKIINEYCDDVFIGVGEYIKDEVIFAAIDYGVDLLEKAAFNLIDYVGDACTHILDGILDAI